jgi:hypothetical protein
MATNSYTHKQVGRGAHLYTWTLGDDDDGEPVSVPVAADRSVQVTGTFDSATITMQGSNLESNGTWATLTQAADFSTAVSFTSAGLLQIGENTLWIRPVEASGQGSVDVTVSLLVRNG